MRQKENKRMPTPSMYLANDCSIKAAKSSNGSNTQSALNDSSNKAAKIAMAQILNQLQMMFQIKQQKAALYLFLSRLLLKAQLQDSIKDLF